MKLSVVLPCYNGAQTLAVQLEALTHQRWAEGWEVIVVNNGSTDNSMAIVERYRAALPALQIVEAHVPGTPRLGVPHSYNTGIQAASGDAFVFCEADDEVAPDWLTAMGRALRENEFVIARLDHFKLNEPWLYPLAGRGYQADGLFPIPHAPHLYSASAAGFGFRRSVYERLGPLSLEFPIAHDGEYCLRAQLAGIRLHFEPKALVYYRERSDLRSRFRQGRSWGLDSTQMYLFYGVPPKLFPLVRQGLWLAGRLPSGARALFMLATGRPAGRRVMAEWIWDFGWCVGKFTALRQNPQAARGTRTPQVMQSQQVAAHSTAE